MAVFKYNRDTLSKRFFTLMDESRLLIVEDNLLIEKKVSKGFLQLSITPKAVLNLVHRIGASLLAKKKLIKENTGHQTSRLVQWNGSSTYIKNYSLGDNCFASLKTFTTKENPGNFNSALYFGQSPLLEDRHQSSKPNTYGRLNLRTNDIEFLIRSADEITRFLDVYRRERHANHTSRRDIAECNLCTALRNEYRRGAKAKESQTW